MNYGVSIASILESIDHVITASPSLYLFFCLPELHGSQEPDGEHVFLPGVCQSQWKQAHPVLPHLPPIEAWRGAWGQSYLSHDCQWCVELPTRAAGIPGGGRGQVRRMFSSLAPWRCSSNFKNVIFKLIWQFGIVSISWEIALTWIQQNALVVSQHCFRQWLDAARL